MVTSRLPVPAIDSATLNIEFSHVRLLRRLLTLVVASVAVTLLLARADQSRSAVRLATTASPWWLILCLLTITATYLGSALVMAGATTVALPGPATLVVQLAMAFANRLAPSGIGGMAVSVRYLQRLGASRGQALASVAANASAILVIHVIGFIALLPLTGGLPRGITPPDGSRLLLGVGGALVLLGVVLAALKLGRQDRHTLGEVLGNFRMVFVQSRHRKALLVGASVVTTSHCLTLWSVVRSVGATAPFIACVVIYLAAAAIGSLSPTPGGIGAIEAALLTGLTATSIEAGNAAAAVLLYHLLTFWCPVIPGAIAFAQLRREAML
ncbi:MAG: YbhN family protein [Acidimicrobiales bacterium]